MKATSLFLRSTLFTLLVLNTSAFAKSESECVVYATEYANSYVGDGDMLGDAVSNGIYDAVSARDWTGPIGEDHNARIGGSLGILDNIGSLPGGWQAMYDMALQICLQQNSEINAQQPTTTPNQSNSNPSCRSSVKVDAPLRRTPEGNIIAGSGFTGCN